MLSCVAARAVASSLLDFRRPHGADGATPLPMKLTGSSGTLVWRDPGHLMRVGSVPHAFAIDFCPSVP